MADPRFVERRTTHLVLADGTPVTLRPILPEDKPRMVEAFSRLSPESRYRRFLAPIDELTPEMLRKLTEIDYVDHFAWVALLDPEAERGIGVARYVRTPDDPTVAEAAVTVIDDYHKRGLGTILLRALGAVALENGIRTFRAYALEDNRPVRGLLGALGARFRHDAPGLASVEIDLPSQAHGFEESPLYRALRAVARGEGPQLLPPVLRDAIPD